MASLDRFLQARGTKTNIKIVEEEDTEEPQKNYAMDEKFLENQTEDNEKGS